MCIQLTCLSSQRAYIEFYLRNYYDHSFHEHTSLESPKEAYCLNPKRYHGFYWKYLLLPSSINSDSIHREYMINLRSHTYVKVIANFSINSIFSQGWETTQWSSLVRLWLLDSLKSWLTISHVQCVIIHTNAFTMRNSSQ